MDEFEEIMGEDPPVEDEDAQDEDAPDEGEADADGSEESEGTEADAPSKKRIDDLMSKWQKSEARNKKLTEQLKNAAKPDGAPDPSDDPKVWVDYMRQQTRDTIYGSDPRFAAYGIEPSAIEGDTPDSMRASATRWGTIMDKIESDASSKTLKKAGLTASAQGGAATKGPVIPESDEDFEKLVQQAKDGY